MDEPWQLRPANAPSEWAIDAYVAGEASAAQIEQVEQYLAKHPEFQAVLDARRGGFAQLPQANAQAMRARILQATEARPAPVATAPPARRRWAWLLGLGGCAAAAAAVFLSLRAPTPRTDPDTIIAKSSGLGVAVFRDRTGSVEEMVSGASVTAGDRLRFQARLGQLDPKRAGHVLVVGVPVEGEAFGYAPAGARASIPVARLEADGGLPGSALLDASTGVEWAHLVWCPTPFALADVAPDGPGRVRIAKSCRSTAFELKKR